MSRFAQLTAEDERLGVWDRDSVDVSLKLRVCVNKRVSSRAEGRPSGFGCRCRYNIQQ